MKDLLNKRFGKLIVIEYSHPAKNSRGKHYWKCKCDCGNLTTTRDSHLIYKRIRSCGCLHKRQGKESPFFKGYGELPLTYISSIKRACKGGGILNRKSKEFDVSLKYLWNLYLKQNRKCAISGLDICFKGTNMENKCKDTSKFTASLDRIDSSKGYIKGNVHWVHKDVNIMKNAYHIDYFVSLCKKITEYHA